MKDLYIIGAGGVGEETLAIIEDINAIEPTWFVQGFVDENISEPSRAILDEFFVISSFKDLLEIKYETYVVIAISDPFAKQKISQKLSKNPNIKFATIIHPTARINRTSTIGEGCIVYPNVILSTNVTVGNHVLLSPRAGVGHGTIIGDFCSILWNVNVAGNVRVLRGVLIGTAATILQNLCVSDGSVVGAGALVTKNVNPHMVVAGVPAKELK